eukprot:CAMPEP_0177776118 /NCGR_PEP_ID=MMETSP0491_2-20121128/14525_1 /TAXON_ID=63592 /ORGANISM="Tetraselmis chuii, Strain PLY429" /LENGTH=179 /DNA_ID=CAMNT_0019294853 /DNA_START=341 /DNA_END=880 /DNA_ORIENTATION=-
MAEGATSMLPRATFVEDVGAFLAEKGGSSDSVLKEMNATYRRYKMVEQQLLQRRMRLETKLPDIKKALDMVTLLLEKKEAAEGVLVDFELHDQVFTKARIKNPQSVKLWLGANVMLEYPLEEAEALLSKNYDTCKANLESNQKELDFLKDSITTTEVTIARVYNYDVAKRKAKAEAGDA